MDQALTSSNIHDSSTLFQRGEKRLTEVYNQLKASILKG